MTFGTNQVTVTVDTVDKILSRVNQDNGGSQYYLHEATQEFTLNVRHSREGLLPDGTRFDRHNVEFIHTVFATDTTPAKERSQYIIVRNKRSDDYDDVADSAVALFGLLDKATVLELLGLLN